MILACSNAAGNNKLKLPFIGEYEKPYASKTTVPTALPGYHNQKGAWMDSETT
jgi:hypothetical protein